MDQGTHGWGRVGALGVRGGGGRGRDGASRGASTHWVFTARDARRLRPVDGALGLESLTAALMEDLGQLWKSDKLLKYLYSRTRDAPPPSASAYAPPPGACTHAPRPLGLGVARH